MPQPKDVFMSKALRLLFPALLLCFSGSGCSFMGFGDEERSSSDAQISPKEVETAEEKSEEEKKSDDDEGPEYSEEEYLRKAESAYARGLYSIAREHLSKLREEYPGTPFESFAQLKTADALFFARDFAAAIPIYEEFLKLHPGHEAAPYARWQIANSYREQYTGPAHDQSPVRQAQNNYERLLSDYPGSYFTSLAQDGLRYCQNAVNAHETYVADFYRRSGKEQATKVRLSELKKEKLSSKPAPTTLTAKSQSGNETTPLLALGTEESAEIPNESIKAKNSSASEEIRSEVSRTPETPATPTPAPNPLPDPSPSPSPTPKVESTPTIATRPVTSKTAPLQVSSKLNEKQLATRIAAQNRSTCRENKDFSIAEIAFDGPFEMRINQRQGAKISAELLFETEEGTRVLPVAESADSTFSKCETKRFSVRLGLPQEREDELSRPLKIQFASGIQYRIFPLDSPKRLVLIAFQR